MRAAVEATGSFKERPRGQLRLAVSSIAERFLSGPFLASFAEANPEVQLDINVTDEESDIVAEGYDAGVRLGEVIEQGMIAVPIAGDERQLPVCSPTYRDRFGLPSHPRELAAHRCIGWRPAPRSAPYRREVAEAGKAFSVAVAPRSTTNDMALMIKLAVAGAGITFGMEESFAPAIARGAHAGAGGLLPLLRRLLALLPQPQERRSQVARADRARATAGGLASVDGHAPVSFRPGRPIAAQAAFAASLPSCRAPVACRTCGRIRA
nr:LysR substrate-binding domain-containing protein [Chelativorans sp.]